MSGRTLLVLQVGERRVHVTVNVQSAHQHEINKWHAVRKNVYGNICLTQVSLEMCFSIGPSQQFCKKRARTHCAKWQKIPHADSHLRKAWLQYVIKLQVSNSIKNKIAGSLVEGNITVPNGAWVRNYDKLNAWELRHLWCGKTAQRKLCEACDEVGFSSVQHAVKSLSIGHFPTRSLSFNTHFLGQRATCSCGVLHGWSHDPCWVAETAEVNANNKVWREETLDIQYWQNFMAIRKVIHGSKLWSVLPPSRWGPLYSHGCKKSCGDVKSFKHRSCLN